ncbi:MAG: polysaccharide deacetylase family protein [Phascolarctobacterium sp.]|nr:polysaccharide deacetylase family protein [Phascolarctobacterium sp.]
MLKNGNGLAWPGGKRIAVMITIDFAGEFLRYSLLGEDGTGFSDRSRGLYAQHEGLTRLLDMLKRVNQKATFFVAGHIVDDYPESVQAIIQAGHELGCCGYEYVQLQGASLDEFAQDLHKGRHSLEQALKDAGKSQKEFGYRAPFGSLSEVSLKMLDDESYVYDSSLCDCDWAYVHKDSELVELPQECGIDDFSYFYFSYADKLTITDNNPSSYVYNIWKDYFDELAEEGDKVFVLKLHPQLIGRASRIRMVERLIAYMRKEGAWITTCSEVASYVKAYNEEHQVPADYPCMTVQEVLAAVNRPELRADFWKGGENNAMA